MSTEDDGRCLQRKREPLLSAWKTSAGMRGRGKAGILAKLAHSIVKSLVKGLNEVRKSERNENKWRYELDQIYPKRLLLEHKRSKLSKLLEKSSP